MKVNLLGKGPVFEEIKESLICDLLDINVVNSPLEIKGDLLVLSGYPKTIKTNVINAYSKGVINIHTSLLPKYRGRHPVDWAMENNEPEIGITVHYIDDESIDTGDIIIQDSVPYLGEGYNKIMVKICDKVPYMLYKAVKQIKCDCVYRRRQNEEVASYYPKRTKPRVY